MPAGVQGIKTDMVHKNGYRDVQGLHDFPLEPDIIQQENVLSRGNDASDASFLGPLRSFKQQHA